MADSFNLPPAADDFNLNVTLSRDLMPYVTEWYQDVKKQGENPTTFLQRLIYRRALNHRLRKINLQLRNERRAAEDSNLAETETLQADYQTNIDAVES